MPLILNATPGDPAQNAYCDLVFARAWYAQNVYATDTQLADDTKLTAALVDATQLLDEHYDWFGTAATTTQGCLWPRYGVRDPRGFTITGGAVPTKIKQATAEMARQLLLADRTADNDAETEGLRRLKAGDVELEFRDNVSAKVISDRVSEMLRRFGQPNETSGFSRSYRV